MTSHAASADFALPAAVLRMVEVLDASESEGKHQESDHPCSFLVLSKEEKKHVLGVPGLRGSFEPPGPKCFVHEGSKPLQDQSKHI